MTSNMQSAMDGANTALLTYNTAVNTLNPTADRWDEIAGPLYAAADQLERSGATVSAVNFVRDRAKDAQARGTYKRRQPIPVVSL